MYLPTIVDDSFLRIRLLLFDIVIGTIHIFGIALFLLAILQGNKVTILVFGNIYTESRTPKFNSI